MVLAGPAGGQLEDGHAVGLRLVPHPLLRFMLFLPGQLFGNLNALFGWDQAFVEFRQDPAQLFLHTGARRLQCSG